MNERAISFRRLVREKGARCYVVLAGERFLVAVLGADEMVLFGPDDEAEGVFREVVEDGRLSRRMALQVFGQAGVEITPSQCRRLVKLWDASFDAEDEAPVSVLQ